MNLFRKHTILNKKNYKRIITFLYSKCYSKTRKVSISECLSNLSSFFDSDNTYVYVNFYIDRFLIEYQSEDGSTYINLDKIIREEKLKRILK